MLFVRSDAGGVSHAPEELDRRRRRRPRRAGASRPRCESWPARDRLGRARAAVAARPRALRPGPEPRCAQGAASASTQLEPLNWNEDRFEPPREVLEAAAAEVFNAALYPERLFADFRDGLARWLDVPSECVTPAHGAQALIAAIAQVFVGHGTPVVVAEPDLRPLRLGLRCGRRQSSRASRRPGSRSTSTRSPTAAVATGARLVWICDPNNPTGTLIAPRRRGRRSSTRLPADCIVIADEAYIDFADPARARPTASDDVLAGRPVIVDPLVLEDLRPGRAARSATRSRIRRSRGCSTSCRSRSTSIAPRSPPASRGVCRPGLRRGSPARRWSPRARS